MSKMASLEKQKIYDEEEKRLSAELEKVKTRSYKDPKYQAAEKAWRSHYNSCPECLSTNCHVEDYDITWQDGEVVCSDCGTYIRGYDAG
jgi:hypothetical protein